MGLRDAVEVFGDNLKGFVKSPKAQSTRALGVLVDGVKSNGMTGKAAESIGNRQSQLDAQEQRALGADGTYSEPGQSGSSAEAYRRRMAGE